MLAVGCIGSTQGYGEHNVFESHDDKYVESIGGAVPWVGQNCGSRYDEAPTTGAEGAIIEVPKAPRGGVWGRVFPSPTD